METKFTKGEWKSRGMDKESNGYISIDYPAGTITAYGRTFRDVNGNLRRGADASIEEAEANAKLIAAAPELFEALTFCRSVIEKNGIYDVSDRMAFDKATNAINKAMP